MQKTFRRYTVAIILLLLTLLTVNGCRNFFAFPLQASQVTFQGPLYVALHEDLIAHSLEKDLILDFGKTRKIAVNFVSFETMEEASELLQSEDVDLVFTRTPTKFTHFPNHFSTIYDDLKLAILCSAPLKKSSEIYIPTNYRYVTQAKTFKRFEQLKQITTTKSNAELRRLALASEGICYVADSRVAVRSADLFPQLKVVWTASRSESVAWITRQDLKGLNEIIHSWFQNLVRRKQIRKFWDRYDAVDFKMTALEHRRFEKDIDKKLSQWRSLFEKHAKKNQIPWTQLAAVAYQESKWSNDAVSFTGVKGLMQLTKITAKQVGVTDREDPKQSVRGGAFYLKYLYDKTPTDLLPYERWSLALSAYNMGWAHLRDARRLAIKLNKDPYRWSQFKTIVPLLGDKKYISELSFGTARGAETVDFVDQVLGYTELLNARFTRRSPTSQDF